jgi:hypothetical protein
MSLPQRATIVIEWENVAASAAGRVVQVLAALAQQIAELPAAVRRGRLPIRLIMPIEVLVLFDPEDTAAADVKHAVQSGLGTSPTIDLRIVPAPGLEYFEMKNYGAGLAKGDLIVFLDSDVIPQRKWLATLLGSFADPSVQAVASRAFVKPDSLYSKTVALTWLFTAPAEPGPLAPSKHFHANGAALRREVILAHPYPPTPGQSRGAGYDLLLNLRAAGITVYEQGGALLDHPPPQGAIAYLRRGLVQGSDDYLAARRRRGWWKVFLPRSLVRVGRKWGRSVANLIQGRDRVHLSVAELPQAIAIVSAYYLSYALGDLWARLSGPAVSRAHEVQEPEVVVLPFQVRNDAGQPIEPRRKVA